MDDYRTLLRHHALRDTMPRRAVFCYLLGTTQPQSISAIAKACPTVNRTTIYRALETFLAIGAVQTVPLGWKYRYELTAPFRAHHHHLQCTRCGRVIDITSPHVEALVQALASQHGFIAHDHTFEITGACQHCHTIC